MPGQRKEKKAQKGGRARKGQYYVIQMVPSPKIPTQVTLCAVEASVKAATDKLKKLSVSGRYVYAILEEKESVEVHPEVNLSPVNIKFN